MLETSHPPVYYLPTADLAEGALVKASGSSMCEFKGLARYFDVVGGDGTVASRAAWNYPTPVPGYESLRERVAIYPSAMDSCEVGGERVQAQDGDFYGGWITSDIVGPFKGAPARSAGDPASSGGAALIRTDRSRARRGGPDPGLQAGPRQRLAYGDQNGGGNAPPVTMTSTCQTSMTSPAVPITMPIHDHACTARRRPAIRIARQPLSTHTSPNTAPSSTCRTVDCAGTMMPR